MFYQNSCIFATSNNKRLMNNYLISEAIGDIAGSAYEGRANRIKDYNNVKMFSSIVYQALKKLPDWMVEVSERFDKVVNSNLQK